MWNTMIFGGTGKDLTHNLLDGEITEVDADNQPGSANEKMGSVVLGNVNAAAMKEWLVLRSQTVRPWAQFFRSTNFKTPTCGSQLSHRLVRNVDHFQSNYLFLFIGLIAFCILTSPLLLIAIFAALGACYIAGLKQKDSPLKVMGRDIPLSQQYAAIAIMSIPVFWLAGAGSAVFWVLGASVFCIVLHASFFAHEELTETLFEMQSIQTV